MNLLEERRYSSVLSEIKVKCSCSHILFFPSFGPDIKICDYCGRKVYRNKRIKFKDILLHKLKNKGGVNNDKNA